MTKPTGRPVGRPKGPPKPKAPSKPRGRPPGSKNLPNSIGAFIQDALENPLVPVAKPKRSGGLHGNNVWATMNAEQRSEFARNLRAKRSPESLRMATSPVGVPHNLSIKEHQSLVDQARPQARRILKIMKTKGELPDLDPRAESAMAALLVMLKSTATVRDKTAIAKTILDFTMSKPTAKSEVTVKTAEDMLDEIADAVLGDEQDEDPTEG